MLFSRNSNDFVATTTTQKGKSSRFCHCTIFICSGSIKFWLYNTVLSVVCLCARAYVLRFCCFRWMKVAAFVHFKFIYSVSVIRFSFLFLTLCLRCLYVRFVAFIDLLPFLLSFYISCFCVYIKPLFAYLYVYFIKTVCYVARSTFSHDCCCYWCCCCQWNNFWFINFNVNQNSCILYLIRIAGVSVNVNIKIKWR